MKYRATAEIRLQITVYEGTEDFTVEAIGPRGSARGGGKSLNEAAGIAIDNYLGRACQYDPVLALRALSPRETPPC